MFDVKKESFLLNDKELILETGRIAKQANGSIFLTYGETCLLITAVAEKQKREGTDFFPLTVDFAEKMYASGKFPGGFFKREARPSTEAVLCARLIDRAIRPLFPKDFMHAVHVVITVLSYDESVDLGSLGIIGASAALCISDIPFHGPVAGLLVGEIDGKVFINPAKNELELSNMEVSVAGTKSSIVMIEAGANEVSEEKLMEAIYSAHELIKKINEFQENFAAKINKAKMTFEVEEIDEKIINFVKENYYSKLNEITQIKEKLVRYQEIDNLKKDLSENLKAKLSEKELEEDFNVYLKVYDNFLKKIVRTHILSHKRPDGRDLDEIRPITIELDVLPRTHGSALFTRGETQSLGVVTLGSKFDEQTVDGLETEYSKNYFLHYNFPPYSVGEVGFLRGPGRRELGHGSLAERAIKPLIPSKEDFPYTIRIVSEITESNGSSSMASVCSGVLSLMAAGVPIKKPVAGIANGLIKEDDSFVVLTDIQGMEDHLGDMDFKVTGTKDGITAIQMDIKIEGITKEIMAIALEKAKKARNFIIDKMTSVIEKPRENLSKYAPMIDSFFVSKDKIAEVIGPSGKNIKAVIEATSSSINIDDNGYVTICSKTAEDLKKAKTMIGNIANDPEINQVYDGIITRIEAYGAFVKFMGNKVGLAHVSKIAKKRVENPNDLLKLDQEVKVKFVGMKEGKIQLSLANLNVWDK